MKRRRLQIPRTLHDFARRVAGANRDPSRSRRAAGEEKLERKLRRLRPEALDELLHGDWEVRDGDRGAEEGPPH